MTHTTIQVLSALGVVGQVLVAIMVVLGFLALVGVRTPLRLVRRALWGYELWLAFVVTAIATGGSLFFSDIANFVPCELCWYQRICMYPLSLLTLLMALAADNRAARYLLPLPVIGAGVSVYHLLVENRVVGESNACFVSAPGGAFAPRGAAGMRTGGAGTVVRRFRLALPLAIAVEGSRARLAAGGGGA